MSKPAILLIDNEDSFTYNIFGLLILAGAEVRVQPRRQLSEANLYEQAWAGVVIGPGPGHPERLSKSLPPLTPPHFNGPVLGICLGHQYLAYVYGGRVEPSGNPSFGIQTEAHHNGEGPFAGLANPLKVGLYNALYVSQVPPDFETIAVSPEGHCLAIRHRQYALIGLQFHPDSILTPEGLRILQNWLQLIHSKTPL